MFVSLASRQYRTDLTMEKVHPPRHLFADRVLWEPAAVASSSCTWWTAEGYRHRIQRCAAGAHRGYSGPVAAGHASFHVRGGRLHRALPGSGAERPGHADVGEAARCRGLAKARGIFVAAMTRLRPEAMTALVASLGFRAHGTRDRDRRRCAVSRMHQRSQGIASLRQLFGQYARCEPRDVFCSQSSACLHEVYESRRGHYRSVRRYYAAPATEHTSVVQSGNREQQPPSTRQRREVIEGRRSSCRA
jgi:hypothetical protein